MPFESDDLGVWVMYTLVFNNGIMKAYKNGKYKDQIVVHVYIPNGQFIGLGQHWWGGNGQGTSTRYTGKIDEARVYSKALTDADILELYGLTDPGEKPGPNSVAASSDRNYVLEYTPRLEGIDEEMDIAGLAPSNRIANITYFDGLGRAEQQTAIQAGPLGVEDIIVPIQYDKYGRAAKKFLPYSATAKGAFQENAIDEAYSTTTDHYQFYNDATNGVVDDTDPFSLTIYEPSPLNRVLKQGAPGTVWQPDEDVNADDHSIKFEYSSNGEDEVFIWKVKEDQCILADGYYYDKNELYVTISKDENWDSNQTYTDAGTVKEYVDKLGRIVLKRTYNDANDVYDTYYVYDDFGNLRFVIPPEANRNLKNETWSDITETNVFTSDTNLDDASPGVYYYCPGVTVTLPGGTYGVGFEIRPYPLNANLEGEYLFVYKYDERQRMIEKKVPGAEPVYMVYDNRDRLVLTQDGEQRKSGTWLFTKYDVLNRPLLTGKKIIPGSQSSVQLIVNDFYGANPADLTKYYEGRSGLSSTDDQGYTDRSYPKGLTDSNYLTATYYDDYDFIAEEDLNYDLEPEAPFSEMVKLNKPRGLATGGKVKNLGDNTWLRSAVYYDRKYRVIYAVSENHVGGWDKTSSNYTFIGELKNERYIHTDSN